MDELQTKTTIENTAVPTQEIVDRKEENPPIDDDLSNRDIVSYGLGGITATMTSQLKSGYHMTFLTEFTGLDPTVVGGFNMALTIWDAINDPIIGGIADRTNTKWGKYRPHMIMGCLLWAVVTMLMFSIPNFSLQGKYVYYIALLFVWSVFYTQFTVPWQALNSVLTKDVGKRNVLLMVRQLTGTIAATAIGLVFMRIVNAVDGGAGGYRVVALFVSVCCVVFGLLSANGVKKRDYPGSIPNPPKMGFAGQMKTVFTNKAVICAALLLGCVNLILAIGSAMNIYYLRYVVGNMGVLAVTSLISMIGGILYLPLMPKILKSLGKKKTLMLGAVIAAIPPILLIIYRENIPLVVLYISSALSLLGIGMANMTCMALIPDCTDYTELHYGSAQAGFINSTVTFMKKFMMSFSTLIVGIALSAGGYVAQGDSSPQLINVILNVKIYIPLALLALILIITQIYPITTQYGIEMRAKLKEIRAGKTA